MTKRKIIEIDREKCNGCGLCTSACAEGALVLDEHKKAVLVKEIFCDGMGACLDVCPVDALNIVERDVAAYDPKATCEHVLKIQGPGAAQGVHGAPGSPAENVSPKPAPHFGGCPGTVAREFKRSSEPFAGGAPGFVPSALSQWPIQLHLISSHAPYFNGCDLLIAADCTAFALGNFHQNLLKGKRLVIACPKLDDTGGYVEKIAELLKNNTVYSLSVVIMEVPCCSSLLRMVQEAVELSGTKRPFKEIVIGLDGTFRNGSS